MENETLFQLLFVFVYNSSDVKYITNPPSLSDVDDILDFFFASKKISLMEMSVKRISESILNKQHCTQTLSGIDLCLSKYEEQRTKENILNSTVFHLLTLMCVNAKGLPVVFVG